MGHAGVYRLARLDIDTRRIVFKAIDRLANWSLRKGRSGSRCLWIRHRISPLFQHDKVGGMRRLNRRVLRDNFKNVGSRFVESFFHRVLQGEGRGRATTAGTM